VRKLLPSSGTSGEPKLVVVTEEVRPRTPCKLATHDVRLGNIRRATYNLATYDVRRAPLPELVCALPAQSLRPRRARDVPTLAADLVVFAYEPMRQSHDTLLQAIDTIGAVS
jgi:hypothetical protein